MLKIDIFHIKSVGHRTCSSTILFDFLWNLPYFSAKYECKFNILKMCFYFTFGTIHNVSAPHSLDIQVL